MISPIGTTDVLFRNALDCVLAAFNLKHMFPTTRVILSNL